MNVRSIHSRLSNTVTLGLIRQARTKIFGMSMSMHIVNNRTHVYIKP